ncbi:MAG: hypothetical protein R3B74_12800 [Nitrospirales bacterium]|nr:hypothetical protein [Nitrospirales bacterium]
MLHRLSLRVLPQLNALVTAPPVRKRKRWVMLAPGLVAFGIYHLLKPVLPFSNLFVLLLFSGTISAITAVWAFRQGWGMSLKDSFQQHGRRFWSWLVGWVGMAYGMQLSLLVLSLLQIFVNYDFLLHPEGPAMMAIIIACTSVTRDAFEIGYVQRMTRDGVPVPTFPDGKAFRQWMAQDLSKVAIWGVAAFLLSVIGSWGIWNMAPSEWQPIIQSMGVPFLVATVGLVAFLDGQGQLFKTSEGSGRSISWLSGLWFWVWPSFTFAATYFLVVWGVLAFVFGVSGVSTLNFMGMAAVTGILMTTYTLYLGWRKSYEEKTLAIPESVQRCPFVMGILQNSKNFMASKSLVDLKANHTQSVN